MYIYIYHQRASASIIPYISRPTIPLTNPSMASSSFSSSSHLLYCTLLFAILGLALAQTTFRPTALVLPVSKDNATLQYVIPINQRTPLVTVNFTVDLGASFLWVDCNTGYDSTSYAPANCGSTQCSLANSTSCGDCFGGPVPGCYNNTCGLSPSNTVIDVSSAGEVAQDVLSLPSTNGSNPGQSVTVQSFIFSCAPTFLLTGLAGGVTGMAGFGRSSIGLPTQLASAFGFNRTFAVCLPSSITTPGPIFFGEGPYVFQPNNTDLSQILTYTPLLINPVSTASASNLGAASDEYFINVTSININNSSVPINATLLPIASDGLGGSRISTVEPYAMLESSIYTAVADAFIREGGLTRVPSVTPFGACFDSSGIGSTLVGPAVPSIDLVLGSESVVWRLVGANTVVPVSNDVSCLAIVDGGTSPRSSIVIGGHQIEDNLLQFDLANSRLGFSSSLLARQTTCSNFNFATVA